MTAITPADEHQGPYVGIFWFVRDEDVTAMIAEKVPVTAAAEYGEFATRTKGHYQHWQALKAKGPAGLKRAGSRPRRLRYAR